MRRRRRRRREGRPIVQSHRFQWFLVCLSFFFLFVCLFGLLSNTEYVNISKQNQGEEKRKKDVKRGQR